jgi:hypothetical protein
VNLENQSLALHYYSVDFNAIKMFRRFNSKDRQFHRRNSQSLVGHPGLQAIMLATFLE